MQHRERPGFGGLLRRLRLQARLSQEALAERARISAQAVSALERGARQAPQRQTLALLADALALEGTAREAFEHAAAQATPVRIRTADTRRFAPASPAIRTPLTRFLGRQAELAQIRSLLAGERIVTVWGPGGVGKTRLAIEAANAAAPAFPNGVFFVELGSIIDGDAVAPAVTAAAGISERPGTDSAGTIVDALRTARALVVLDNCEHLLDAVAKLAETLARATTVVVLCTSREPLHVAGERVYALEPLAPPHPDDTYTALRASAAVQLFLDRAEGAGADFDADADDLRTIATICRRLDGLPLAIELAAARLPSMSPRAIAAALDERFRLLSRGARTAPSRQQTLAGALDWSYDLLDAAEQVAFRRLAVLSGTWTFEAALAVGADEYPPDDDEHWRFADVLADLVDKALITVTLSRDEQRYRMLETTRDYAHAKLRASGEQFEIERRHAHAIRSAAHDALAAFRAGEPEPFGQLDVDNVRAALHWSIARGNDPAFAAGLAGVVSPFWDTLGLHVEGLRWIDESIGTLDESDTSIPAIEAWMGRSRLAHRLELFDDAVTAAERAIALADRSDATLERGMARVLYTYPASRLGHHQRSAQRIDEAEAIFASGSVPGGMSLVLHARGVAAARRNNPIEARDAMARVLALHRSEGSPRNAMHAAIDLAEAEYMLGDRTAAIEHAREALATARTYDAQFQILAVLGNLAAYLLDAGEIEAAAAAAHEACSGALERRFGPALGIAILHCALIGARRDEAQDAALLTGFVDAHFGAAGPPGYTEQRSYDALIAAIAERLTPEEDSQARDAGAQLTGPQAAEIALRLSAAEAIVN